MSHITTTGRSRTVTISIRLSNLEVIGEVVSDGVMRVSGGADVSY